MSHGHLIRREELTLFQTCGEFLSVKHLFVHYHNYIETRKNLGMLDNLFEAQNRIEGSINKTILISQKY